MPSPAAAGKSGYGGYSISSSYGHGSSGSCRVPSTSSVKYGGAGVNGIVNSKFGPNSLDGIPKKVAKGTIDKQTAIVVINVFTGLFTAVTIACGVVTVGACDALGMGEADAAVIGVDVAVDTGAEAGDGILAAVEGGSDAGADGEAGASAASKGGGDDPAAGKADGDGSGTCPTNSFTGSTLVLLSTGTAVAIDSVTVGDKVLATNTKTGKTEAKAVTKLWLNHDDDLMDVTVMSHGTTSVIHTTQHHLFWEPNSKKWVEADRLTTGTTLASTSRASVGVAATHLVLGQQDMWDLTVDGDHDFYVVGASTVLVHNCPTADDGGDGGLPPSAVADKIAAHSDHDIPGVAKDDVAEYVENMMSKPGTSWRPTPSGIPRTAWYDPANGAIVVREGSGGTVFVPGDGTPGDALQYFLDQAKEN